LGIESANYMNWGPSWGMGQLECMFYYIMDLGEKQ
jgi:hypothetical protein